MTGKILDFQCAVVTGGAGGLGFVMAEWFIQQGKKVILVGRTESNLKEASSKLNNASYYVLDTGKISDIPDFAKKVVKEHPEVDCLVNNAGVQRPLDVTDLNLGWLDQEIDINVRGPIHLANAFLPHFLSKKHAVIANVSSVLGIVPFSIVNPGYNGTKAYMHFYSEAQRVQLAHTPVRVVEILPPQVATALHRDRVDPADNTPEKSPTSLTPEQFMQEVAEQLQQDKDVVTAGPGKKLVGQWYDTFGQTFAGAAKNYDHSQPKIGEHAK